MALDIWASKKKLEVNDFCILKNERGEQRNEDDKQDWSEGIQEAPHFITVQ